MAECRRKTSHHHPSVFTGGRTNSLPEDAVPSTIPEDGSEPPNSGTATQRRKLFLNIRLAKLFSVILNFDFVVNVLADGDKGVWWREMPFVHTAHFCRSRLHDIAFAQRRSVAHLRAD